MSACIVAHELGRWYGPVVGLNELEVSIDAPITGLLGPNGAGKSTFLKLVAGEIRPSRGSVEVFGERPFANRRLFRRIGFSPQQDALYDHLTGLAFVTFLMRLHGFDRRESLARARRSIERVGLVDAAERATGTYSKGMRQRVKLAQSIAHDPDLLIVDEPLSGLDPVMRHEMIALFRELAEHGMRVLVSSHILHEVEALTNEIVLLHRGRLLAQGTVGDVRDLISRHPRKIELEATEARRLARHLVELDEVSSLRIDEAKLSLETRNTESFFKKLTTIAAADDFGIQGLMCSDENLEAVFDYLVQ